MNTIFKMLLLLFFLFGNFYALGQTQIRVVDSLTNESVPFVQAAIDSSTIIIADYNGIITIDKEQLTSNSDIVKIVFNHLAYETKVISSRGLGKSFTLKLAPKVIVLNPVDIVYKQNTDQNNLIVKGFYRTYQLNNDELKYYSDGFVEYIIPLYKKSKFVTINILEHRTYWNEELVKEEKQRAFNVKMDNFSPPFLYGSASTILELKQKFKFKNVDTTHIEIIDPNSSTTVGNIGYNRSTQIATLNVDIDFPNKTKIRKAFGFRFLDYKSVESEMYFPSELNLQNNNYEHLAKKQEYRKILFKHKSEKEFSVIETSHELYVIEKRFITKEQLAQMEITSFYDVQFSSSDSLDYNEKVSKLDLTELPEKIRTNLKHNLSKIEPDTECFTCDN